MCDMCLVSLGQNGSDENRWNGECISPAMYAIVNSHADVRSAITGGQFFAHAG